MLSSLLAVMAARGETVTALRFHCAGTAKLTANTNLTTLNQTLSGPQAVGFQHFALNQLATLLSHSWKTGSNSPPLIDPLLTDLLENESVVAIGPPESILTSFVTAVRVNPQQSQLWNTQLGKLFGGSGGESKNESSAEKHWPRGTTGDFWTISKGNWLLFGQGTELAPIKAEFLQKIGSNDSPAPSLGTNWLEGDLDLALLAPALPEWAKLLKPAQVHIQIAPRGNDLEIRGKATYPTEIAWTPNSWQEPKNLVLTPLISFTAGQGVAAFLQISPQVSNLPDNFLTNQFFGWALGMMPLESYLAWPVPEGTNSLQKLTAELPPFVNPILKNLNKSQVEWQPKMDALVWTGLNVVSPTLSTTRDNQRDYLLLSLFPNPPATKPAPAALWKELETRQNLVYYDWEVTGERLQQMRLLPQMIWFRPGITGNEGSMEGLVAKDEMLGEMSPKIGVTVTEVTRTAPNELFIIRKGPIGLTGFEMVELSDWLSKAGSP
jgi:hypothetical protein